MPLMPAAAPPLPTPRQAHDVLYVNSQGKPNYAYDRLADLLLEDPTRTRDALAKLMNFTPEYISMIRNSDGFKTYFAKRRAEFNAQLNERIAGAVTKVAQASLNILAERLEGPSRASIPTTVALDTADKMLERLGYGVKPVGVPAVVVNQAIALQISPDELNQARQAYRAAKQAPPVLQAEVVGVAPSPVSEQDDESILLPAAE